MKNLREENVIAYTVSKVASVEEMYILVQNGEVEITAPINYTNKQIQKMISQKREWILKKIEEYNYTRTRENNGIERNPIKLLGKEYKIKIVYRNVKVTQLDVEEDVIVITLANKHKGKDNKKILNIAIEKLYSYIAEKEIECVMEKTRVLLGYAPKDYKIEKMNSKYAKYEKGMMTINPLIIKFDKKTIEKIILEQFLKIKNKNIQKKCKAA